MWFEFHAETSKEKDGTSKGACVCFLILIYTVKPKLLWLFSIWLVFTTAPCWNHPPWLLASSLIYSLNNKAGMHWEWTWRIFWTQIHENVIIKTRSGHTWLVSHAVFSSWGEFSMYVVQCRRNLKEQWSKNLNSVIAFVTQPHWRAILHGLSPYLKPKKNVNDNL